MDDSLQDLFQRVYVINLDRRADRWRQFLEDLPDDWPFRQPTRVAAFDWRQVPAPAWWDSGDGAWGCYRSHLRVIEDALNQGLDSILVFEDDAILANPFRPLLNGFLAALPDDWCWIYLGGQHIKRFEHLPVRVNDWVYKPHNVNRSHAYAVRGRKMLAKLYHHLLDHDAWESKDHVDHHFGKLHGRMERGLYVPSHWLVGQREGKSNIAGDQQDRRFFRGAASLVCPPVRHPIVSTVAPFPVDANTSAELLQRLGIDMGTVGKPHWQPKNSYRMSMEAPGLHHICSRLVAEPDLTLRQSFDQRVSHLRGWAWKRGKEHDDTTIPIGGMHRDLVLLWPEMQAAWRQLKLVVVSGSSGKVCQLRSSQVAQQKRLQAWEGIVQHGGENLFQLDFTALRTDTDLVLGQLCDFLGLSPSSDQLADAKSLLD